MITQLNIVGTACMLLALLHGIFPAYFQWKQDLQTLSLINRQLMYVHTFFIGLTVFLMGLLCVTSGEAVVNTPLGHRIALGLGVFWVIRLAIQFFGYSSVLWRGKPLETGVHILFSILWLYFSAVFFIIFWRGWVDELP
jgi:hypothetical protein